MHKKYAQNQRKVPEIKTIPEIVCGCVNSLIFSLSDEIALVSKLVPFALRSSNGRFRNFYLLAAITVTWSENVERGNFGNKTLREGDHDSFS